VLESEVELITTKLMSFELPRFWVMEDKEREDMDSSLSLTHPVTMNPSRHNIPYL
jgi:hypothetical protein